MVAANEYVPPAYPVRFDEEAKAEGVDVQKLGRCRPETFASTWKEVAFVASMLGSLAMADFVISGFQVVLPFLLEPLNIPHESQTWPSSALTLVAGATLFPLGRLTDMYGGYIVFNGGLLWFTLWTVMAGFANNFTVIVMCRAMEGFGAAAFLPAGISILGKIYRPGPRKNIVFSLYGALCPLGFWAGIMTGGLTQELLSWRWYFWIGGMLSGLFCVGSLLTAPRDYEEARKMNVKMDWWGLATTVPGMLLVVYAVTDSSHAPGGWASPRILVPLVLGLLFVAAAVYVEGWLSTCPLIPGDIFHVKYMKRMLAYLCLSWGVYAIYLYYSNFYIEKILGKSALTTALWFAPWAIGGLFMATTNGLVLHILPGRVLLIFAATAKMLAVLFFALMPDEPSYWAWVLPAMVAEAVCVGVLWTVSNVYLTTCLPRHRQGLAGALVTVTLYMGGAMFLAVANVARGQFVKAGFDLKEQYKGVFWIGFGVATVALVLCVFVKLGKAGCTLTVDEMAVKQEEEENIEQVSSSQDSQTSIQWVEDAGKDEAVVGVGEDTRSGSEENGVAEHRVH